MNTKQVATEIADTPEAWENGALGQSLDHGSPAKIGSRN